jgi:dihydrofolate reductase
MRKIILQEMMSLDGFMAGPKGEFDWPLADEEFERHTNDLLNAADTILLGRNTHLMFASYWPTAASSATGRMKTSDEVEFVVPTSISNVHKEIASKMNAYRKIVFSKTLDKVEWNSSVLAREVDPKSIVRMKEQPGKNILLLGSAELVWVFMKFELIDEYRIWVNPIILGSGKPLFGALDDRQKLKLVESKPFNSGLIELWYQQAK